MYFSLLSYYQFLLHLSSDISVGSRWASGWLFKKGWKERIIEKLREYSRNPNLFDFNQFVDYVFSSDFKSDCKGKGIDLVTLVSNGMHMKDVDNSLGKKIGDISNIIGIFVDTIASLFHSRKEICKSGSVITPNIIFTQKLFLEKIGGFLVLASVSSSQYLKAMLIDLIKTARTLDQQFGGSHEADVLKDFKSEIDRYLAGKIPSKKHLQKPTELFSFTVSEMPNKIQNR